MLGAFELFRLARKNAVARTAIAQCARDPDGHRRGVPGDRRLRPGAWACGCASLCPRGYAVAVVHGHRIDHGACVRWTISSAIRSKRWRTSRPTAASTSGNFSRSSLWEPQGRRHCIITTFARFLSAVCPAPRYRTDHRSGPPGASLARSPEQPVGPGSDL